MKLKIIFLSFLFILALTYTQAEDVPIEKLLKARSIKCVWGEGISTNWNMGKVTIEKTKWHPKPQESFTVIDSIDINKGTARLIANVGATDAIVLSSIEGLTILEKTASGNLSIITIFPQCAPDGNKFYAVMSRHMNFTPQGALPSQWYGTAEILE